MHKTSEWLLSFRSSQKAISQSQAFDKFRSCQKISVTGGKGGVGKTSIALKAAQELARCGHRTLLVDCDSNLSNTAIKLGLPLDNKFEKLLSGNATFEECLIQQGNFHLLPACNGSIEVFESKLDFDQIIHDIIVSHEHEYDYILLDCPAGVSREILNLNAFCDHRWIVVTPDKSSITDSYSLIKILNQKYNVLENHLLVNMWQSQRQQEKVAATLSETVENYLGGQLKLLGGIQKLDVSADAFDTFFLSENKSEWQKNFVKLLYTFTEKDGGPLAGRHAGNSPMALGQDVQ